MADKSSFCIITVMDRLWFHQIILLSETSISLLNPKSLSEQSLTLSLQTCSDDHEESSSLLTVDEIPEESPPVIFLDESNNEVEVKDSNEKERPTRLNLIRNRARSQSSSPVSSEKRPTNARHRSLIRQTLQKSRSCRSMGELELEEVKGFMDLGFIFKKEHLSPRMIQVIPGLQRLGLLNKTESNQTDHHHEVAEEDHRKQNEDTIEPEEQQHEKEEEEEEKDGGVIRPYLSEAWLIKRPDSPLLNLKMPSRMSASADMKKHIKSWARTVASVIQNPDSIITQ